MVAVDSFASFVHNHNVRFVNNRYVRKAKCNPGNGASSEHFLVRGNSFVLSFDSIFCG